MPGGLIQLIAVGSQGLYIVGNPEISYFRTVYKRHTNFAMESIRVTFQNKPVLSQNSRTIVTANIPRNGDLVKDIYIALTLPAIYSSDVHRFQWVPKIGNYIINNYSLLIGGQRIDRRYGEWLDIWNELTLPTDKIDMYNKMIGHVPEIYQPRSTDAVYDITNNALTYLYYPAATPDVPSISSRKLYIPLQFFFTRNPALAIPLICLQYHNVDIEIEFAALREIYQIFDSQTGNYLSPAQYLESNSFRGPAANVGIGRFLSYYNDETIRFPPDTVDIDAYLEVNYVFLDDAERKKLAVMPQDYLIEQVYRYEREGIIGPTTFDMVVNYPVKEFIWVTRRSDMYRFNNWTNFTNDIFHNENRPILKSTKFMFNGVDRMEEKDGEYYHLMQPYLHHTRSPRQGIYTYSFCLYPERSVQPSGFVNFSTINRLQMSLDVNPRIQPTGVNYEYNIILYSLSYNILRIMGGMGGMVFSI